MPRAQNSQRATQRFLCYWQKPRFDAVIAKGPGGKLRRLSDMDIEITVSFVGKKVEE